MAAASGSVPGCLRKVGVTVKNTFLDIGGDSVRELKRKLRRNSTDGDTSTSRPPAATVYAPFAGAPSSASPAAEGAGAPSPAAPFPAPPPPVGGAVPRRHAGLLPRDEDMGATPIATPSGSSRPVMHHCPVQGCSASDPHLALGWRSTAALRSHVDGHLVGALVGVPAATWLASKGWTTCAGCTRTISVTISSGWHSRCWAREQRERIEIEHQDARLGERVERPDAALATDLPDLEEVACADIPVIEHVPAGCLSLVETEYRRLLANVILCNRGDAWQETDENSPTYDADIEEKKARARVAWQEWWMFPKCCLGTPLKGGQRRKRKTEALLRSRLERWHHGERVELWADAEERESTGGAKPQGAVEVEKQQKLKRARARHYAAHGMPAKAVQRLTTAGMAPDTAETEKAMRSKFPEPPVGGQGVDLPAAPPANELSVEEVRGAICAFARGAAAGPSGLRPDLLRQLIERGDSRSSLRVMTAFANMLADGKAPDRLAPWVAGAAGHAFRKRHKPGAPEEAVGVRPVCCGEAWRRLVSKALLGTEREAAVRYLQPYQLAVGVSAGVEAVPHVARAWKRKYEHDPERVCLDFDESNAYNCVSRWLFWKGCRWCSQV